MPFFSKSIADLGWSDIHELLDRNAPETVRLEFKEEVPGREELAKKVCSFANTYGGYILIGAREKDGDLVDLPGVELQASLDQQLVQWCFEQLYPPVVPLLSPRIKVEGKPERFLYVIFVEESADAPHFVNKRKGCYVRTDEYSQRFEPRLATLPELEHLLHRRESAIQRRQTLLLRAEKRFSAHAQLTKQPEEPVEGLPQLTVAAVPQYPGAWTADMEVMRVVAKDKRIAARGKWFPDGAFASQARGFYFLRPRLLRPSYLELDAEGLVFYREVLEPDVLSEESGQSYLNLPYVFAWVIFYLRYFAVAFRALGFNGTLSLFVEVDGVGGRRISAPWSQDADVALCPPRLDDEIKLSVETNVAELSDERLARLCHLYRDLALASGCREAYEIGDDGVKAWVTRSCKYLGWGTIDG